MSMPEVASEDNVHKLFMELTQKGKQSIITILNMDRSGLKDLKAADANRNAFTLDYWEVSEIININMHEALFEDFKLSPAHTQMQHARSDATATLPSSLTSSYSPNVNQNRVCTPAESLRKGIKRDSAIFNTFKDGKQWDASRRHLRATSMAQDIDGVLNKDCNPVSAEEKKFMHSIFGQTLLTDQGKALV